MYKQSLADPETFWAAQAQGFVTWPKPWDSVLDWSFDAENLHINWFKRKGAGIEYNQEI